MVFNADSSCGNTLRFLIALRITEFKDSIKKETADDYIRQYRELLKKAKRECPPPDPKSRPKGRRDHNC